MSDKKRQCVFCGRPPTDKNREHILPMWLLEMTGDPRRTVTMAIDPQTGDAIKFAWQALVMPACEACNLRYAELEGLVKPIVISLLERRPIDSHAATVLLDWLDKVRICLWLNQVILQKTRDTIDPHLHVNNRIRSKDRMLYVYTIEGASDGLNGNGIESVVFQHQPSCFALRINDIILFNASSDFAFSEGCGFWHPEKTKAFVDGPHMGQVAFEGYLMTRKLRHPIVADFPLLKAAIRLYQPIAQRHPAGGFFGPLGQNESYHVTHMLEPDHGLGIIFQQFDDVTRPIYDRHELLHFEDVDGATSGNVGDIIAQTYRFQTYLWRHMKVLSGSPAAVARAEQMGRILAQTNEARAVLSSQGRRAEQGQDAVTIALRDALAAAEVGVPKDAAKSGPPPGEARPLLEP